VPGYPITLAVLSEDRGVYLAQLILGVIITLLLFYMAWRISGKAWFAALVALAHTLNLGQLFFEANLLTETISTFWVVAALAGFIHGIHLPAARRPWLAFLIGAAAGLEILFRPNFVYLPFWLFGWMVVAWQVEEPPAWRKGKLHAWLAEWVHLIWRSVRRQWLVLSALALPVACLVLGWMGFIHRLGAFYHDWLPPGSAYRQLF
jgi:4-amino-4-deoxy-L-arabinose transferase-like glycosyltransferase